MVAGLQAAGKGVGTEPRRMGHRIHQNKKTERKRETIFVTNTICELTSLQPAGSGREDHPHTWQHLTVGVNPCTAAPRLVTSKKPGRYIKAEESKAPGHQAHVPPSLSSRRWQWFPCLPRGPPSTWSQKFPGSCPSGSMHVTVPGLSRKHAACLLHPRPICLPTSPSQQHRGTTGRDEMSPTCGYPSGPGAAAGCSKNTGLRSPGTQRLWWLRGS